MKHLKHNGSNFRSTFDSGGILQTWSVFIKTIKIEKLYSITFKAKWGADISEYRCWSKTTVHGEQFRHQNSYKTICDRFPNQHDNIFRSVSKPHLAACICLGPINRSKKLQVLKWSVIQTTVSKHTFSSVLCSYWTDLGVINSIKWYQKVFQSKKGKHKWEG